MEILALETALHIRHLVYLLAVTHILSFAGIWGLLIRSTGRGAIVLRILAVPAFLLNIYTAVDIFRLIRFAQAIGTADYIKVTVAHTCIGINIALAICLVAAGIYRYFASCR